MSVMFPNEFWLRENKRLNNEEDKQKLVKLKEDLFINGRDIVEVIKENIKTTTTLDTVHNISFRNNIADEVSKHIRKKMHRLSEYEIGEVLLCKNFNKRSGHRILNGAKKKIGKVNLNNNCKYRNNRK